MTAAPNPVYIQRYNLIAEAGMSHIRLLTRADDAGLLPSANRAILRSVKSGAVRNISIMAPAPEIEEASELLAQLSKTADLGLHVTLTAEWQNLRWGSVLEADRVGALLRRDGTFHLTTDDLIAADPNLEQVMAEVGAQYELLRDLGFEISYVDEHMGIGKIPGLSERIADFARQHQLRYSRALRQSGKFAPLPGWNGPGEHPGTELADHLAGVEAGTYLLVGHPGTKDEDMQRLRKPGQPTGDEAISRNRQRRMFMDIEILDYVENAGIRLMRYSEL
jgi:hypothetical protein